jgi:hypothetical protein
MPAFISVLLQGFFLVLTSTVGQWLFGLGVGVVAYTGINLLTANVYAYVVSQAAGMSSSLLAIVHMMGLFTALNIILSGVAGKFAMSAAGSGTFKKFILR